MNVSMMDSYNLSWKLAHSILGLTPQSIDNSADPILETFEQERVDTARQLIEFDAKFSHMFSGKIGSGDSSTAGLTHDEFLEVFRDGSGFTSGCGLEYKPSKLVRAADESGNLITSGGDPLYGALTTGRRVLNVELKRYADNTTRQLHDELPSHGRYRILVLTSTDLLDPAGKSQTALQACTKMVESHPAGALDLVVLHPLKERFEWIQIPADVKRLAEMRIYGLARKEDAYDVYGISKEEGAIAVVRPDGYVGVLCRLSAPEIAGTYLKDCLVIV